MYVFARAHKSIAQQHRMACKRTPSCMRAKRCARVFAFARSVNNLFACAEVHTATVCPGVTLCTSHADATSISNHVRFCALIRASCRRNRRRRRRRRCRRCCLRESIARTLYAKKMTKECPCVCLFLLFIHVRCTVMQSTHFKLCASRIN